MKASALFFFLLCIRGVSYGRDPNIEALRNYSGDINEKYKIGMTLIIDGDQVEGVYFYTRYLTDIKISGHIYYGNRIRLAEYDEQDNVRAMFDGEFLAHTDQDPRNRFGGRSYDLHREILVGQWKRVDSDHAMPFYLGNSSITYRKKGEPRYAVAGAVDDELIHKRARRFRNAVRDDDRPTVAESMLYPGALRISDDDIRDINNEREFLEHYDKIFTPAFRQIIGNSVPHNMFVKYSGIMLGNGEVWFDHNGKVFHINAECMYHRPVFEK